MVNGLAAAASLAAPVAAVAIPYGTSVLGDGCGPIEQPLDTAARTASSNPVVSLARAGVSAGLLRPAVVDSFDRSDVTGLRQPALFRQTTGAIDWMARGVENGAQATVERVAVWANGPRPPCPEAPRQPDRREVLEEAETEPPPANPPLHYATFNTAGGNPDYDWVDQKDFLRKPVFKKILKGHDQARLLGLQEVAGGTAEAPGMVENLKAHPNLGQEFKMLRVKPSRLGDDLSNVLLVPERYEVKDREAVVYLRVWQEAVKNVWNTLVRALDNVSELLRFINLESWEFNALEQRGYNRAVLKDTATGETLTVYNTHLSLDDRSRLYQARQLVKDAVEQSKEGSVLILGDLNAPTFGGEGVNVQINEMFAKVGLVKLNGEGWYIDRMEGSPNLVPQGAFSQPVLDKMSPAQRQQWPAGLGTMDQPMSDHNLVGGSATVDPTVSPRLNPLRGPIIVPVSDSQLTQPR